MPPGADPHEFALSARQAADLREADLVVANGGGFEAGLDDTLDAAEDDGATVVRALDAVDRIDDDPHFFTDPDRMAVAARAIVDALAAEVPALDTAAVRDRADAYVAEHGILVNPLAYDGYPSIGCAPCTRRVAPGEDPRAGRWAGQSKVECGLHV